LSNFLAGKSFKTQDEVENAFRNFINSKNLSFYKSGIEKLVQRWLKQSVTISMNKFDCMVIFFLLEVCVRKQTLLFTQPDNMIFSVKQF